MAVAERMVGRVRVEGKWAVDAVTAGAVPRGKEEAAEAAPRRYLLGPGAGGRLADPPRGSGDGDRLWSRVERVPPSARRELGMVTSTKSVPESTSTTELSACQTRKPASSSSDAVCDAVGVFVVG